MRIFKRAIFLLILIISQGCNQSIDLQNDRATNDVKWHSLNSSVQSGLLGERLSLWRNERLWYVVNSDFLLSGFESPPGSHLWQGEHVGKWLHAATLDYEETRNVELKTALDNVVDRLLKTQAENGYIGTYEESQRFYNFSDDPRGWDVWTQRYNLYGLLTYERYHPNEEVVEACKRMADLLIEIYGEGKADITQYGTRQGISAATLLESIMMLYERTKEERYLSFAEQIVAWGEANPRLRLMDAMLKNESVVYPGDGKAYQLMAYLIGFYRLYLATGNDDYLQTVLNGWDDINKNHVLSTGGPWGIHTDYNGNRECFAKSDDFDPGTVDVENCSTVTWIQLNLHLFEYTGEAVYAEAAERALVNHFFGHQHSDGISWCYYTRANQTSKPWRPVINCCASSGPRAMEMFARYLVGEFYDRLSINNLFATSVSLSDKFGNGKLHITGNYPYDSTAEIVFEIDQSREYVLEFRLPSGTSLNQATVNGETVDFTKNARSFYEITNKWEPGDKLSVDLEYHLNVHSQPGENGKNWVAFSYGPLSLAQKTHEGTQLIEPFKSTDLGSINIEERIQGQFEMHNNAEDILFTITDSDIVLVPYHMIGIDGRGEGPRTYFEN